MKDYAYFVASRAGQDNLGCTRGGTQPSSWSCEAFWELFRALSYLSFVELVHG